MGKSENYLFFWKLLQPWVSSCLKHLANLVIHVLTITIYDVLFPRNSLVMYFCFVFVKFYKR